MQILVLNSGSSSTKFAILATAGSELQTLLEGEASGLGTQAAALQVRDGGTGADAAGAVSLRPGDGADAASAAIAEVVKARGGPGVDALGYRVVHPGPRIREHCRLTPEVLEELKAATVFAQLHQPPTLHLMQELGERFKDAPAFCCFDTVFHETMPAEAQTYALPESVRARGVRRYGFHGLSCEGVVRHLRERAAEPGGPAFPRRLLVAHLGSGCSVTAIRDGESVENTMGLTPDGGVVMGTRPGDLDPGVVLYLVRRALAEGTAGEAVDRVEAMLNRESGTAALAAMANDMRAIRRAAQGGEAKAALALRVFARGVRKAIGAYAVLLGGVDALVFTGGIGEHDAQARSEMLEGAEVLGLRLDAERNRAAGRTGPGPWAISPAGAASELLVMTSEEDATIARHVAAMMKAEGSDQAGPGL